MQKKINRYLKVEVTSMFIPLHDLLKVVGTNEWKAQSRPNLGQRLS